MKQIFRLTALESCATVALVAALGLAVGARPQTPPPPQQPSEISTTINGSSGEPPRFAVPPFIPLSGDAETAAVARTIADTLWDDLNFEKEFLFIPRDIYATIPVAKSFEDIAFDRWRELNTDGVIAGTVLKSGSGFQIQVRLFDVKTRRQVFGKEYSGSSNARLYAHTISDDIHLQQRALRGVARTKLAFDSDRDGERLAGTVENRGVKEIYTADYDGENQRRLTTGRSLNINPAWSPNGRSIAYASWRRGPGNIFVSHIYDGTLEELTKGPGENWLPAWSPDGTRIAFTSTRDGNSEIYVANRDGSNARRLTNQPSIDSTPTWSPSGTQIAFTSDRSGTPQIYIVAADGLGSVQRLTSESVRGPAHMVAGAVQRNRLHVAHRARLRHQGHGRRYKAAAAAHLWRRQQRKPGLRGERPAHRIHDDAVRQGTNRHDGTGREEPEASNEGWQQLPARLVEVAPGVGRGWSTRCRYQSPRWPYWSPPPL